MENFWIRISCMLFTAAPLIFGGVLNMLFTKTTLYQTNKKPLDGGLCLKDGKRIFGDNKTDIGFVSMIIFSVLVQVLVGFLSNIFQLNQYNDIFYNSGNHFAFNVVVGFFFGFTYMIAELPNSFIKRRLNIMPGKTKGGVLGVVFFIYDQIDSLILSFVIIVVFGKISFIQYIQYLCLGFFIHLFINICLYFLKIRKNI